MTRGAMAGSAFAGRLGREGEQPGGGLRCRGAAHVQGVGDTSGVCCCLENNSCPKGGARMTEQDAEHRTLTVGDESFLLPSF